MTETESTTQGPGAVVSVAVPVPVDGTFDYRWTSDQPVVSGQLVKVPFGGRMLHGVVWADSGSAPAGVPLKPVADIVDLPPFSSDMRQFVEWVASYTMTPLGAVLRLVLNTPRALEPPAEVIGYTVPGAPESTKTLETLASDLRMTPARRRVLDLAMQGPPMPAGEMARQAAVSPSVVKGLVDRGVLCAVVLAPESEEAAPDPDHPGPTLSETQQEAAAELTTAVELGQYQPFLLDGVTGAGKTEVYFDAIARILRRGGQVLVLLPEIALSAQWLERFHQRFGAAPTLWHSDIGATARRRNWRRVATGQARVVVGARSALFLPFADLRLIIVDEEHDPSYKQDEGVIYNARDMAVVRARLSHLTIVLASATPSLETILNGNRNRYRRLHLPTRHGAAQMPQIDCIDLRREPPPRGRWIAPALWRAIESALTRGEQAMLFLNRRGYAPLTLCRTCGYRLQCPTCSAWLVEHRMRARLVCHHCGHDVPRPKNCPECDAEDSLAACGPGIERLAEEVQALMPDARFLIASSDTLKGPAAAAELVRAVEERHVDLVLGTQLVAKGYHFPLLTLVGVVDADLGLAGGDLRAVERTYQLLYQVAGRAGRADRPGRVLMQTYNPQSPMMEALVSGERDRFLDLLAEDRQREDMPPFGRLVSLLISGAREDRVDDVARRLGRAAPVEQGVQVLGPAPAGMALLRGQHRRRLLLKASRQVRVQSVVRAWLSRVRVPGGVRIKVDIDPQSFL